MRPSGRAATACSMRLEVGQEGKGDRAVDIGEDRGRAGPEALEQAAELVGEADTGGDQVVAAAHQRAQRPDLLGDRGERCEAVAVGAQDVGEHVGVARIAFAAGGTVARAARLHDVGMDRHHRMAGGDQGLDEEAGRPLDGDRQLGRRREAPQPREQVGKAGGIVSDLQARHDAARAVEHADGVAGRAPVEAGEKGHGRDLRVRVTLTRAGRSCGSLIDRRSCWQASARHPVVRPVLPAPAARRVSHGPSKGERAWPSRQTLGLANAKPKPRQALADSKVHQ